MREDKQDAILRIENGNTLSLTCIEEYKRLSDGQARRKNVHLFTKPFQILIASRIIERVSW